MRVPIGVWVVAGVVVGAAGAAALVASGALDRDPSPPGPVTDDPAPARAADEFVEAWERSRLGTYVVVSTFRRTFPGGGGFTAERSVAQRPPDRLERSFGSITARLDGRVVLCRTAARAYRCETGPARRSYRSLVRAEVETLRTYVEGPTPLYSVTADGDCFDLALARPLPAPPYGNAARFCFARATGATTLIRVERDEATDVTQATEVRAAVRESDLRPPQDGDPSDDAAPRRDEE